MIHDIIFLLLGLILIIVGGNYLTEGAEKIAKRAGISPLVIGLTVIAVGSSTPDLVVCVMSAAKHKSELALGDVVGANIFDILLVSGLIALISPVKLSKVMAFRDMPMLVISTLALLFMCNTTLFDGISPDAMDRSDALVLLLFFCIYAAMTVNEAKHPQPTTYHASGEHTDWDKISGKINIVLAKLTSVGHLPHPINPDQEKRTGMSIWLYIVMICGGLGALIIGGNWIVDGASGIALKAGMSEAMVGLTIVAIGSSLPDLATSVIAALKDQPAIALGNVVGSCVFNILFVLGISGCITPLECGHISFIDFAVMACGAILLWTTAIDSKRNTIGRGEGCILVTMYILYMFYLILFRS